MFHVKYFAKPFCGNATLLSPVFYFNKVRKFRVVCTILSDVSFSCGFV